MHFVVCKYFTSSRVSNYVCNVPWKKDLILIAFLTARPFFEPKKKPKATSVLLLKIKVAFIQKGLMRLSFLPTDEPNYFPELEFLFFFQSKWLKSCQIRIWSCSECSKKALEQLQVLIWHDLSHLERKQNQNSSSGK